MIAIRRFCTNRRGGGGIGGELARALNEDPKLTLQLVKHLDHASKLRIANAILDEESADGRTYSDYLAAKHRRAIMVREISVSVGEDVVQLADHDGDGKVSSDELDKWLKHVVKMQKSLKTASNDPSTKQLWQFSLLAGIPFIGFGFVDNFIMLVAGDMIDISLGRTFGISTLAAAGLGNLISDVAGLGVGGYIESASKFLGLKDPKLTIQQIQTRKVRLVQFLATSVGISIGCLLGMAPLMYMETAESLEIIQVLQCLDVKNSGIINLETAKSMVLESSSMLTDENSAKLVSQMDTFFKTASSVSYSEFEDFLEHMKSIDALQFEGAKEKFAASLFRVLA